MKGGDVLRAPEILPTGRNLHGFDPFRLPASFAHSEGCRQAEQLLARHQADAGALPESVALVLWGTDNLKTEGVSIAQALASACAMLTPSVLRLSVPHSTNATDSGSAPASA